MSSYEFYVRERECVCVCAFVCEREGERERGGTVGEFKDKNKGN